VGRAASYGDLERAEQLARPAANDVSVSWIASARPVEDSPGITVEHAESALCLKPTGADVAPMSACHMASQD